VEVLAIGNELLDGRVADTNSQRLASALGEVGLEISQRVTVVDEEQAIIEAARAAVARGTELCVVSGGLGPTADDVTAAAFAGLAGVELVRDAAWVERIESRFASRGFPVSENQRQQADRPRGAELIENPGGTAPGFSLWFEGCRFVAVPGVPSEFDAMVESAVVAPLRVHASVRARHELRTFGLIEGEVDRRLKPVIERFPEVGVGFRATFPEIHVTLSAGEGATESLTEALVATRAALGPSLFSESGEAFAATVLRSLRERGLTLATAESCTGGLAGDMLTDDPGSSDTYLGGVVAYHNQAKVELLNVEPATLERHGAVSEKTVSEMAEGVRQRLGAQVGIATSGVAGPGGGSEDKPVGTVWLAMVGPGIAKTRKLSLPFDRRRNKVVSAYAALELVRRSLRA
jgi:nicotinamide-nucleotide amidase